MLAPATKCRHKQWCHGDEWEQHNPGNIRPFAMSAPRAQQHRITQHTLEL